VTRDDEMVALLREIRDLLVPVSDGYLEAYEKRLALRHEAMVKAIRSLLSTDKRRKAWGLADGTRTQTAIAKESGMAQSGTSMFFKELRDLGALSGDDRPRQLVEGV
jgi:hypothetical protein